MPTTLKLGRAMAAIEEMNRAASLREALAGGEILTAEQAAAVIGITAQGVRAACRRGGLPATRIAGVWILERSEVEKYAAADNGNRHKERS